MANEKIRRPLRVFLIIVIILCVVAAVMLTLTLNRAAEQSEAVYTDYLEDRYPNLLSYELFTDKLEGIETLYTDVEHVAQNVPITTEAYDKWLKQHPIDDIKRTAEVCAIYHAIPAQNTALTATSVYKYLILLSVKDTETGISTVHYLSVTFENEKITQLIEVV